MSAQPQDLVLVTGATGFLASHAVLALQDHGFAVRGTVRSLNRRAPLLKTLSDYAGREVDLDLKAADLNSDDGWDDAVEGCRYVLHVASPFPAKPPKRPEDLINPARNGALRVLRAADRAGVERVVMTSSTAAISYGWGKDRPSLLSETHWSNPDNLEDNSAYTRSKTIAEQAAWDFYQSEARLLDLTVVNPGAILGPLMSSDVSTSISLVTQVLQKRLPRAPRLSFPIVDVRDVADLHIRAMLAPEAKGERFIAANETLWFADVLAILDEAYPERKLPKGELPNWVVRLAAQFNPVLKQIAVELNQYREVTSQKARDDLGWSPRPAKEAILASAESAIRLGLV